MGSHIGFNIACVEAMHAMPQFNSPLLPPLWFILNDSLLQTLVKLFNTWLSFPKSRCKIFCKSIHGYLVFSCNGMESSSEMCVVHYDFSFGFCTCITWATLNTESSICCKNVIDSYFGLERGRIWIKMFWHFLHFVKLALLPLQNYGWF